MIALHARTKRTDNPRIRFPFSWSWVAVPSVATLLVLSGCSLMNEHDHVSRPDVRDVGSQSRNDRELVPRKRVLVLPFINGSEVRSERAAKIAREALIKELRKNGDFVFVAAGDFPKDVSGFLKNGEYDLEAMAKLANSMGLAAVIEGKVVDIHAKRLGDTVGLIRKVKARIQAVVQVRVVSAKNGHIVLSEQKSGEIEDSVMRVAERSSGDRYLEDDPQLIESVITEAFSSTAPHIAQSIDKIAWEGRVALIRGDRIFLNAGRVSGLQVGDILKVTDEGEDVYDPETGALIGRVPGRLKGTVEVVSYFGKDGAVSIVHSGSGFKENDLIELY